MQTDRPRVLVTTSTLPRFANDSEPRFVLDLSRALTRYFDMTVLAPAWPRAALDETIDGVRILRYRYAPLRGMETLAYPGSIPAKLRQNPAYWPLAPLMATGLVARLRGLLSSERFHCVHAHWTVPQGVAQAVLHGLGRSPPYVITVHGTDAYTWTSWPFRRFRSMAVRRASAVTIVSDALRQRFGDDVDPNVLHTIPMGVDRSLFNPERRDASWASRHGLAHPVILFVGRLSPEKGVEDLLAATSREPLRSTSATLAIVGEGPLRRRLSGLVSRLALEDRVRFLGAMEHRRLAHAFASADVCCVPSVALPSGTSEGSPTVLAEAVASGTPVVAAAVGGIPRALEDLGTGALVPPNDAAALSSALAAAIERAPTDRVRRQTESRRAASRDWTSIARRFATVIQGSIDSNAPTGPP